VRAFVQRHGNLLQALPGWTVRTQFFKRIGALGAPFERVPGGAREHTSPTPFGELWRLDEVRDCGREPRTLAI
jgi:hypothetical protein